MKTVKTGRDTVFMGNIFQFSKVTTDSIFRGKEKDVRFLRDADDHLVHVVTTQYCNFLNVTDTERPSLGHYSLEVFE
jgi:hypothetical protein